MWMYRAERACRAQLAIQQAGVETVPMPDAVIATRSSATGSSTPSEGYRTIGVHEWPALLRKLDRQSPGYRE